MCSLLSHVRVGALFFLDSSTKSAESIAPVLEQVLLLREVRINVINSNRPQINVISLMSLTITPRDREAAPLAAPLLTGRETRAPPALAHDKIRRNEQSTNKAHIYRLQLSTKDKSGFIRCLHVLLRTNELKTGHISIHSIHKGTHKNHGARKRLEFVKLSP